MTFVEAKELSFLTKEQGGSDLAGDCSANDVRYRQMARAGWGVVQWGHANGRLLQANGPVPVQQGQSAVAAEHEAVARAAGLADHSLTLHVD